MFKKIKVRIAPSPTGFLHIGLARTALFNYLFAKKYQGDFILRIEDTDKKRSSPEFEKDILESLKWLGLDWNEKVYRQSERTVVYKKYLEKLIKEKKAYYCFCSKEELDIVRKVQIDKGLAPNYTDKCFNLSDEEVKDNLSTGKSSVIRFKVPAKKIIFKDLIRGNVEFDTSLMGDFVIAKNLTTPLYNFVVAIDDFEMKITHIIRGEDHISNTPKQILVQQALNFYQPEYAHLPLILNPDKSKLSKRHNAVSVTEYKKIGYLPEALINFMVLLGWSSGNDEEFHSLSSLVNLFSLEKVQKGGAIFNTKKLDHLNSFYIRRKPIRELTELCIPYLIKQRLINNQNEKFIIKETKKEITIENLEKIILAYQERLKKLSEISELIDFFFKEKLKYDKELLRWKEMLDNEIKEVLNKAIKVLSEIKKQDFNKEKLEEILLKEAEKENNRGVFLWPIRVALTGKKASASLFEVAEILGKEKTIKRIKEASKMF